MSSTTSAFARAAARAISGTVPVPSECVECRWTTQARSCISRNFPAGGGFAQHEGNRAGDLVALALFAAVRRPPPPSSSTDPSAAATEAPATRTRATLIVRAAPGELNRISVAEDAGRRRGRGPRRAAHRGVRAGEPGRRDLPRPLSTASCWTWVTATTSSICEVWAGQWTRDPVTTTSSLPDPRPSFRAARAPTAGRAARAGKRHLVRDHTAGVTVRLNGLPDDGSAGEGDNVLGSLGSIEGGSGDDTPRGGPGRDRLAGGAGNDPLVGSPEGESLLGQDGRRRHRCRGGNDRSRAERARTCSAAGPGATRRLRSALACRFGSASATGRRRRRRRGRRHPGGRRGPDRRLRADVMIGTPRPTGWWAMGAPTGCSAARARTRSTARPTARRPAGRRSGPRPREAGARPSAARRRRARQD